MGFTANAGLPFQPVSRGANEVSKVREAAGEKEVSGGTADGQDAWQELVGVFWPAPRIHEPSPVPNPRPVGSTDAFLGSPPPAVGGRVAQATRAPGARRRGCAVQGPRRPPAARGWKVAPSQVRGPSPGAAALGALPGPVLRSMLPLCPAAVAPSPGLRSAGRSGPETRSSKEAAMKGPRPRSSRDTVAANETEKGCRFGPNLSVTGGDAEDTEDRPEGVTPGPQLG